MNWKQPIPTNLLEICKWNKFASTVFMLLLLRTRNEDWIYYLKWEPIELKRWQCACWRLELWEYFWLKVNQSWKIFRVIEYLKANYLIDKQKSRNCSIITIINYDEIIWFEQSNEQSKDNQKTIKRQSTDTNKNDNNVKNEKKSNKSKDLLVHDTDSKKLQKEENRKKIDLLLLALKNKIWCSDFKEINKYQRQWGWQHVRLLDKIGKDEYLMRLSEILEDNFKLKNASKLEYLYKEIKWHISSPKTETF